jgi:acyl-CoA dehydrogenase
VNDTDNAEIEDIRKAVRSLCAQFPIEYWDDCDKNKRFPAEFRDAFAKAGWLGVTGPEEYGGGGGGLTVGAAVLQEVARSGGALSACTTVHTPMLSIDSLRRHGSEELKERFLPSIIEGSLFVSFGVTEADAGTDTTQITTRAEKVEGGYRVSGSKTWNSGALEAEYCLLLVRTTPLDEVARKTDGMTLLMTPMNDSGVTVRPIEKIGRHAVDSNDVFFDDVFVPEENRVGEEGKGFKYLLSGLNSERILLASEYLGMGYWALDRAVAYANERVVFNRPIGKNQSVQHPLAQDYMQLTAAQLTVDAAIRAYDSGVTGDELGALANTAKYLATEAAYKTTDDAMQTHGGYAFSREYQVGRYWIESRLGRVAPVNNQMVLNYIAERVLKLPRSY